MYHKGQVCDPSNITGYPQLYAIYLYYILY